jgi:hypothetical protein
MSEENPQPEVAERIEVTPHQSAIESRHLMALRRPRNEDLARQRLLHACKHPAFAEKALYKTPRGKGFSEGFTIRFAEEAARCWRNVVQDAVTTDDSEETRTIYVSVTDLESNDTWAHDLVIEKTVERHTLAGRDVRKATERELLQKLQSELSRAYRSLLMRLLPAALKEECMATIRATMADRDAKDPDAAKKRMQDAFMAVGVDVSALCMIETKPLAQLQPAELQTLREVHQSIKEGQTTWMDVVEQRGGF